MNDDLKAERAIGRQAAVDLANHTRRMNSDFCQQDILIEDERYVVTCQHHPVDDNVPTTPWSKALSELSIKVLVVALLVAVFLTVQWLVFSSGFFGQP